MSINRTQNQDLGLLSYLRDREIGRTSQATKLWQKIEIDERSIKRLFPEKVQLRLRYTDAKKYISMAHSKEEILERIQKFANKISKNQTVTFTCYFHPNPEYQFHMEVGYGNAPRGKVLIKEVCLFMKTIDNDRWQTNIIDPMLPRGISFLQYYYFLPENGEFGPSARPEFFQKIVEILATRGRELEAQSIEELSSVQI